MKLWDLDDLVGLGELAHEFCVTPQAVANWRARYAEFPKPVKVLRCGSLYSRREVVEWHVRWFHALDRIIMPPGHLGG